MDVVVKIFRGIHGVGKDIAQRWYQLGYRTLDDIKAKVDNLTEPQKLGLKYYDVSFLIFLLIYIPRI